MIFQVTFPWSFCSKSSCWTLQSAAENGQKELELIYALVSQNHCPRRCLSSCKEQAAKAWGQGVGMGVTRQYKGQVVKQ